MARLNEELVKKSERKITASGGNIACKYCL